MRSLDRLRRMAGAFRDALTAGKVQHFPSRLTIGTRQITDITLMGGFHRAGVTKAGRLSFRGRCDGRQVKVYSTASAAQTALRQALQTLPGGRLRLPEVIAAEGCLVAEEWIDGVPVSTLRGSPLAAAESEVKRFLTRDLGSDEERQLAHAHGGDFCYLRDYLIGRLGPWRHVALFESLVAEWSAAYAALRDTLPRALSHPDLSQANLIAQPEQGHVYVIDNELLGIGHGWILDWQNSLMGRAGGHTDPTPAPRGFVELSWRLRCLGSALDAGDLARAVRLAEVR